MLIIGDFDPDVYPVVGGGKIRVFNTVVENGVESREVVHNRERAKPLRPAAPQKRAATLSRVAALFNTLV